jgi:hypothetical protein
VRYRSLRKFRHRDACTFDLAKKQAFILLARIKLQLRFASGYQHRKNHSNKKIRNAYDRARELRYRRYMGPAREPNIFFISFREESSVLIDLWMPNCSDLFSAEHAREATLIRVQLNKTIKLSGSLRIIKYQSEFVLAGCADFIGFSCGVEIGVSNLSKQHFCFV